MQKKKYLTAKDYAEERGITLQAVTKMIREKGVLPGIKKIERMGGRFYLLTKK
jgi:predicted transcriptional regulator